MLASKGVKKGQAEKALTVLADKGKIKVKEFGKTKIFFLSQEHLPELDPEEKVAKLAEIKDLTEEVRQVEDTVSQLRKGTNKVLFLMIFLICFIIISILYGSCTPADFLSIIFGEQVA